MQRLESLYFNYIIWLQTLIRWKIQYKQCATFLRCRKQQLRNISHWNHIQYRVSTIPQTGVWSQTPPRWARDRLWSPPFSCEEVVSRNPSLWLFFFFGVCGDRNGVGKENRRIPLESYEAPTGKVIRWSSVVGFSRQNVSHLLRQRRSLGLRTY